MKYLIVVVVLLFALAGCGGASVNVSDEGVDVSADGADVSVKGDSVSVNAGSLNDIITKKPTKWKATYSIDTDGIKSEVTQIFDAPRFAMKIDAEGRESHTIFDGKDIIICTKQTAWSCMKMEGGDPEEYEDNSFHMTSNFETQSVNSKVSTKGTCSRAGETGRVFEITTGDSSSTVCYTNDGIVLELTAKSPGMSYTMTATSVSRSVSASDFTPPAEPQDLSAMLPPGFEME